MAKRIEEAVRDLMLVSVEGDPLEDLVVWFRGDPNVVPVKLYPFGAVFITLGGEGQGTDGYTDDTGPTLSLRYDGFVSVEVLHRDASALVRGSDRKIDVPSHDLAQAYAQAALNRLRAWGPSSHTIEGLVTSQDGKELTSSLSYDAIRWGLNERVNNVSNLGTFEFHIFTRRREY